MYVFRQLSIATFAAISVLEPLHPETLVSELPVESLVRFVSPGLPGIDAVSTPESRNHCTAGREANSPSRLVRNLVTVGCVAQWPRRRRGGGHQPTTVRPISVTVFVHESCALELCAKPGNRLNGMKLAFRCGHELDAAVKIDLEACLQRSLPSVAVSWSSDDVDLYHAATLGGDATDRSVLESSEGAPVLPTFATALGLRLLAGLVRVPGLHFRPEMLLSAGHDLELRQELPRSAQGTLEGRISALFDEGWAASLVVDVTLRSESGQVLSVDHYSAFLRGAGGFGGTSAQIPSLPKPTRPPDHRCRCATLPQQALLYRLTGDRNPLHSDPIAAAVAGFPRPILHGACTLGLVSRTLMSEGLVPEASRLARIRVRFEGAVFPGENLLLSVWDEAGRLHLHATTEERRSPVLSAVATPVERQTSERSPARTSPPSAVGTARAIGVPSAG